MYFLFPRVRHFAGGRRAAGYNRQYTHSQWYTDSSTQTVVHLRSSFTKKLQMISYRNLHLTAVVALLRNTGSGAANQWPNKASVCALDFAGK